MTSDVRPLYFPIQKIKTRMLTLKKASRPKPKRLAEKLIEIREALGLSQNGMINRLGLSEELTQAEISSFERKKREPPLPILLKYAKIAGICTVTLIDDDLNLPKKLPASPKHRKN